MLRGQIKYGKSVKLLLILSAIFFISVSDISYVIFTATLTIVTAINVMIHSFCCLPKAASSFTWTPHAFLIFAGVSLLARYISIFIN